MLRGPRPLRPHLGEVALGEKIVLHFLRELEELAALDGHDLLAADVALVVVLPHHPAAVALPADVVDPDRHPRSHMIREQQREGQADRAAAADGDPQHGRGRGRLGELLRVDQDGRLLARHLEFEPLACDHDLVARPQAVGGNGGAVHPGAIAAAPVGDHVVIAFLPHFRVQPRDRAIGDNDVALAPAESNRLVADHEAFAGQVTVQPHDGSFHCAISRYNSGNPLTSAASTASPTTHLHGCQISFPRQYLIAALTSKISNSHPFLDRNWCYL
jgi:hypothetical protein